MKKIAAILLVLVLALSAVTAAFAEQKVFAMTTIADLEGNVLATLTEDGVILDAEGNDVTEQFPVLCVSMDDETMTCAFGNADEMVNGTVTIVEQTEDGVVIEIALENGEVFQMLYTVEGTNALTLVDEESGLMFIMPEISVEAAE